MQTPGGSGWGDPKEWDVDVVRWDVLEGLVSLECARQVYGVVIDAATMAVDEAEARCRRRSLVEG